MRTLRCSGWLAAAALIPLAGLSAHADDQANRLVNEVIAATSAAKSLTADISLYEKVKGKLITGTGKAKLKRPNLALVTVAGGPAAETVVSDGKTLTMLMPDNQYMQMPVEPNGKNINLAWAPINLFFHPQTLKDMPLSYAGKETIGARTYEVLEQKAAEQTTRIYVDSSKLITRLTVDVKQGDQTFAVGAELASVKLNVPLTASDLAFQLPKTAKLYKQPDYNAKLIPVGKMAEKFDLMGLAEKHVTLDDAGAGKKAVLVNFWFYG